MAVHIPEVIDWTVNQPIPLTLPQIGPSGTIIPSTGSYTVVAGDFMKQLNSGSAGGTLTVTLANTLPAGFILFLSVVTNDITLSATGGANIQLPTGTSSGSSGTTYTLSHLNKYQSAGVIFDGTNFWLVTTQGTAQFLSVDCIINGGGITITAGNKGWVRIPVSMTITKWNVSADQSGSIVVDIQKVNAAAISGATSMVGGGGNSPTLSSAQFNGAAPSGWTTTALGVDDWVLFKVTGSPTSVQIVTVDLTCQRQ